MAYPSFLFFLLFIVCLFYQKLQTKQGYNDNVLDKLRISK